MGLLGLLLEWLFPTREEPPHEDYHIDVYQKDGVDMLSLLRWERGQRNYAFWLEIMERLMAGRLCATQVEQWSCIEKREERRRTEITYCETFPMRYGQEHLLDSKTHTRLTDGWKELIGVGAGTDRAMLEEMYSDDGEKLGIPWVCTLTLFALKDPPEEMTYEKVKAAVQQPGLFSIYYDIDEDWLDMTLPDEETKRFVLKTIREIMTAHGKSLDEPEGHSMGFLEFLKWTFSKDARYVPLLALSEGIEDGEKELWFSCEGDYNSECCEIVERLCTGRYAVTWMEDLFWKDERQEKKKREIIYHTTFPMYYAREIAGMDDLQRMAGGWKELISVSEGFDRTLFAAFLEKGYVFSCDNRTYVLESAPHVYHTLSEVQALRELPCRLTIEYTPCDGALIFRDYSLAVRREIIRTVKDVCRERGHELTVLLDETQE